MSEGSTRIMRRICPGCEADPPGDAAGSLCSSCGGRLLELRPVADERIGQVIDGRFEIRARIGKGGMGTVYRAWQRSIGREVAIKLIDPDHAADPLAVRRFLREARLASQLSQPNTVSVIDFGQAGDGRLFIAMELVRGRTLKEALDAEGAFAVERVVRIGVQLCDAVEAAHRLSILHRDLKPSNMILLDDPPGRDLLKVLDFGLAKALGEQETEATQSGLVVGTPRYMAPEVVSGASPSPGSDLYSIGVILGELASGRSLWDVVSTGQLLGQKLQGSPLRTEVPEPIRGIVDWLLTPDPAHRPGSAVELRTALLSISSSPSFSRAGPLADTVPGRKRGPVVPHAAPRTTSKWRGALGAAAVAAVLGTTGGLWIYLAEPIPSSAPHVTVASPGTPAPPVGPLPAAPEPTVEPARVTVHVSSRPSGALISLDGKSAGVTPTDLVLVRGASSVIEVTLGDQSIRRTLTAERDQDLVLVIPQERRELSRPRTQPASDELPF